VPGEVEFAGRGVTYCAICDGPVFAGQRVLVVGGGNSALEAALDMVKIAEHVDLVARGALTGDPILVERLSEAKNLTIFTEHETQEILGHDFVEEVVIKDLKSGEIKRLDVSGVFIEIGLVPNSDAVKGLVELNELGEVRISRTNETSVPGLYAAGDVTDIPEKQIIIAAGEGAKAALQAHRYLQRLEA
jgi:alkyl hydroperoxide reductase subunit F